MNNVQLKKAEILDLTGHPDAATAVYQQGLKLVASNGVSRAMIYARLGGILRRKGEFEQGLIILRKAENLTAQTTDDVGVRARMNAFNNVGIIYSLMGNYELAFDYYQRSMAIKVEIGDRRGQAVILNNSGIIYMNKTDYEQAMNYFRKALAIYEEIGDRQKMAGSLINIGIIYLFKNDYERAMDYYQQAQAVSEETGDQWGQARSLSNIGVIHFNMDDYERAFDYYQRALVIHEETGERRGKAIVLRNMGTLYQEQGDNKAALVYYDQSISIARKIGYKHGLAATLISKAKTLFRLRQYQEATPLLEEGLAIAVHVSPGQIFRGTVLKHKLTAQINPSGALRQLQAMLTDTTEEKKKATLHYELFQLCTENEEFGIDTEKHRQTALELYQKLYEKTPKFEYKNRIEALEQRNEVLSPKEQA